MRAARLSTVGALVAALALVPACTGGSSSPSPTPPITAASTSAGPSASPSPSVSPSSSPVPPSGHFSPVGEADFQFTPAQVVIGTDQGLRIHNAGPSLHNMTVTGSQIDLDTPPGQTSRTEPISGALAPGTYPFFCKYHRARGMVGVLIVVQS
jgi:plastocyanin